MGASRDLIPASGGLAAPAGSLARPELPRSTALSPERRHEVDLEERMDPLAVAEATAEVPRKPGELLGRAVLFALAAAAVFWLLPRPVPPPPPPELPEGLQEEAGRLSAMQLAAEREAIALVDRGLPTEALVKFRTCVDGEQPASVNLWRSYLQTLVDLNERDELRLRARQFRGRHPDRLEGPHFQAEAIRRDDVAKHRERKLPWGSRPSPVYLAEIDAALGDVDDALATLDRQKDDWSAAERTQWADKLHLDRARLHHHAWKCAGFPFADPRRERALAALRSLSDPRTTEALELKTEIYRRCLDTWPRTMGWRGSQLVDGRDVSWENVNTALEADRAALGLAKPAGRR
jgi:hypothetical protein